MLTKSQKQRIFNNLISVFGEKNGKNFQFECTSE